MNLTPLESVRDKTPRVPPAPRFGAREITAEVWMESAYALAIASFSLDHPASSGDLATLHALAGQTVSRLVA